MYKLMFDGDQFLEIPIKGMKIGLARWTGTSTPPRYMYLWIKEKYVDKSNKKLWETLFYHRTLLRVETYSEETGELINTIPVSSPFLNFYYEEGDIVAEYGDSLYADDAY